ncbi:MAG: hypothetical protein SFU91_12780 [Chloroherpetonaceae bacterium]|nr:hypothetical protein [Chloroherpetonaceae bacterium]
MFSGFAIEWLETQVNRHQKLLPNVAFLILIIPLFLSYRFFTKPFILERSSKINKYPFQREEIKPALEYLAKNSQKNQKLYIPYLSKCSFLFYQKTNFNYGGLEFELMPLLTGRYRTDRMDTNLVKPYFEKINGKIWVLLSHTTNTECKYVEKYIGKRGKGGLVFDTTNTFLYFYEIPVSSTQIASK